MANYQRHKISYCLVCGYVDLSGTQNECEHCNTRLMISDEYFDVICAQLQSNNKDDVEEYVRQLYVYPDERFDEANLNEREENEQLEKQVEFYEEQILNSNLLYGIPNKPKCPTCSSTDIEKISVGKKVAGGVLFGLFSSDVRNTMQCNSCGYKW